jgi:hypothetical protein
MLVWLRGYGVVYRYPALVKGFASGYDVHVDRDVDFGRVTDSCHPRVAWALHLSGLGSSSFEGLKLGALHPGGVAAPRHDVGGPRERRNHGGGRYDKGFEQHFRTTF